MSKKNKTIWTIGHSTRTPEEFLALLQASKIQSVADIRNYPGSSKYPHFNSEALAQFLSQHHIGYIHLKNLGGRRKPSPHSRNTAWRSLAFRGFADYMQSTEFKTGIHMLEKLAMEQPTAYMCSEAVWWRCHRSMVADYLKVHGWKVMHILGIGKEEEHPFTAPAKVVGGDLSYEG